MPTAGVLPGSRYYKVTDASTLVEKYMFYDGAWYPVEKGPAGD